MKNLILLHILFVFCCQAEWVPKILWTYWQQQIQDEQYSIKAFTFNHQNMISKDWKYRFLNKKNCWKWIDQIPEASALLKTPEFQAENQFIKRSMFIRLVILKHYGGVWIDYSTILTENLDWLFRLRQIQVVRNKQQKNPEVFIIYNRAYNVLQQLQDKEWGKNIVLPLYEFYFIACSPNSWLMKEWLQLYMSAKKIDADKHQQNTQKQKKKSQIIRIIQKQKIWVGAFKKLIKHEFFFAIQIVVQRRQRIFNQEWSKSDKKQRVKTVTNVHGIWTAEAYTIGYKLDAIQWSFPKYFVQQDIQQLKKIKKFPKYLFKMNGFAMKRFCPMLDRKFQLIIKNNKEIQKNCPINTYFTQNTMFYQYMLQFYPKELLNKDIIQTQQQQKKDFSKCEEFFYKFKKQIYIKFSQKPESFVFISNKQYNMYLKLLQNLQNQQKKSGISFSTIKHAIDKIIPSQSRIFLLTFQPNCQINLEFFSTYYDKTVFAFTNSKNITIISSSTFIQRSTVMIQGYQFFEIRITGYQISKSLYIFNNKNIQIYFENKMNFMSKSNHQFMKNHLEFFNYRQIIKKQKQKQNSIIIILIISIATILVTAYLQMDRLKKIKFKSHNLIKQKEEYLQQNMNIIE